MVTSRIVPYVIVPMAGFGRRFLNEGYTDEKPLIQVGGKSLLEWSLLPIPESWRRNAIGIVRHEQSILRDSLFDLCYGMRFVELYGPTQGAACSVLAAAVGLPSDEPVIVMNADQWFRLGTYPVNITTTPFDLPGFRGTISSIPDPITTLDALHTMALTAKWDGFILTFPGKGPAWSYAVTNGTNRVVHVIEKKEVSPYATVGVYWWRRASDLVRSICAMIATGQKTNQEYYLAPSYNFLPLSDKHVEIVEVEEFMGLGTPEQVAAFDMRLQSGWQPCL